MEQMTEETVVHLVMDSPDLQAINHAKKYPARLWQKEYMLVRLHKVISFELKDLCVPPSADNFFG